MAFLCIIITERVLLESDEIHVTTQSKLKEKQNFCWLEQYKREKSFLSERAYTKIFLLLRISFALFFSLILWSIVLHENSLIVCALLQNEMF